MLTKPITYRIPSIVKPGTNHGSFATSRKKCAFAMNSKVKVKSESASAAKQVKKKIKLEIPPDAAGGNECHFYFVVKDSEGGEKRSDPLFVDRAPFKFSVYCSRKVKLRGFIND